MMESKLFIMAMCIVWLIIACVALFMMGVGSTEAGRAVVILNIWLAAWMVRHSRD